MKLIARHLELGAPIRLSSWRKAAIGTWGMARDPSVYGVLELNARLALQYLEKLSGNSKTRVTLTHFVGKVVAETLRRHPEINCVLRFGRIYPRKHVTLFFQVAGDSEGADLSGMTVVDADQKSVLQMAQEMEGRLQEIKSKTDRSFARMKSILGKIPALFSAGLIHLVAFILYPLNLWSPLFGTPPDPFGGVMITNIGSIGLEMGFAALVGYTRVPILFAVGRVREKAIVEAGKVVIAPMMNLCVTFDHRLFDGVHASRLAKTITQIFANPDKELS